MIELQSLAGILWPCPSGTFENSPVIYDWVHRPQPTQSPGGTAETLLSRRLGVLMAKIRERAPKIRNPLPGSANLCQPLPGPGEGEGLTSAASAVSYVVLTLTNAASAISVILDCGLYCLCSLSHTFASSLLKFGKKPPKFSILSKVVQTFPRSAFAGRA